MHRRRITRILGTAVAAVGLLPLATSGAAPARAVDASDFPGLRQVAAVVPAFAGGSRTVEDDHAIWIFKSNCSSYVEGPSGEIRTWAYYYPGPAEDGPVLWIHIQEFARPHDAKQAIRVIRRNIEGCYGTHHLEVTDATLIRRAADVPPLGDGRPVAWKMNDHWTDQDTGTPMIYYSRRIWMREAETVIGVDLWGEAPQSRAAAIKLARVALSTVD